MQISRIGVSSFGANPSAERMEKARYFLALNTTSKLNHLYGMLEDAADERKVLAQNQAKIFEKMKEGFRILATHGDNCYTCSGVMGRAFDGAKLKNLKEVNF